MFFELVSLGCSFNSSGGATNQARFYPHEMKTVPADEIASGVVGELLTLCRSVSRQRGCTKERIGTDHLFSYQLLISPLFFTCFAYVLIVIIVRVGRETEVEESTIPQQVFCFKSLLKPFVEILPQPRMAIPMCYVPSLWRSLAREKPEADDVLPAKVQHGKYWAPEPEVEYFDPAFVDTTITWKPTKSLFSYENWY